MSPIIVSPTDFTVREASWQADRAAIRHVRQTVFIDEQAVPEPEEWDGRDAGCTHLLAEDPDGAPIGTARLLSEGKLGRMAVLEPWRGRGVGRALMARLIRIAEQRGHTRLVLDAQVRAIAFYEPFGFRAEGPVFDDAGIPHRKMVRAP